VLGRVRWHELLSVAEQSDGARPNRSLVILGLVSAFATIIATTPALAAPPPQALVVVSGRSVLQNALAGTIMLPDGQIDTQDLESLLLPYVLQESDLLLWDVASESIREVKNERLILRNGLAGAYQSDVGRLDLALIEMSVDGSLASMRLVLPGGTEPLASWLDQPGRVAIFNPLLPLLGVPEPDSMEAMPVLALGFILLARIRVFSRRSSEEMA
jgi:hypothetical protein